LPEAFGEILAAAVGGQKEEEEPRIRIVERWPASESIVSWFILLVMKKILFPSRNTWISSSLSDLCFISNPLVDQ
jgi:hypothetical protein